MIERDKIFTVLREARKGKGLSQTELSSLIGVPQSHISKIESGNVDIQLSSLSQIARSLDLEIQLVPKKALPAVQSIIRATQPFSYQHGKTSKILSGDFLANATNHVQQQINNIESGNSLTSAAINLKQSIKLKESQFGYLNSLVKNSSRKLPRPAYSLDNEDE